MFIRSPQVVGAAIFSIHTGHAIGKLARPIFDPNNLSIVGFYTQGTGAKNHILMREDIRQLAGKKAIVDSGDVIVDQAELIRLKELLDLAYTPINKQVRTESKRRLGRVSDYAINPDNFMVQKLYVKPTLIRSFMVSHFLIDRSEIVEVTDSYITVKDAAVGAAKVAEAATNPLEPA